jgi:nucleoside-diphosphate-sugar epimerase
VVDAARLKPCSPSKEESQVTYNNHLHVVLGTGPVGMAVMNELVSRGTRVRMVNRSGRANVPEGVEVVGGDAADPTFTREVSAGASVVYNALNPPYDKWPELFPRLQAGVLEGAASTGAKLIAMENLYMYGPTGGRPITENLPYAANTRKGTVRARMSQELMEAHKRGKVRLAIGRASDFFGPRVLASAAGEQVFGRAVEGKSAQVAGDPDQPHTYTYAPDIGRGLVILGEREEALGRAWHLPSPETVTTREFVGIIFEEVGMSHEEAKYIVDSIGIRSLHEIKLLQQDDDLWLTPWEGRELFEGEEGVEDLERSVRHLQCLVEMASETWGLYPRGLKLALGDARDRAEEALRRARERAKGAA